MPASRQRASGNSNVYLPFNLAISRSWWQQASKIQKGELSEIHPLYCLATLFRLGKKAQVFTFELSKGSVSEPCKREIPTSSVLEIGGAVKWYHSGQASCVPGLWI